MVILSMQVTSEKRLNMHSSGSLVKVKVQDVPIDIPVGPHYVVISGSAKIHPNGMATVATLPYENDAQEQKGWDAEVVIGPIWRDVMQCSPMVAPGYFYDGDNDSNDVQGWALSSGCSWEEAEVNNKKRIKLKFRMVQWGESSKFVGVVYHVAATGYVIDLESTEYLS